MTDFGHRKAQRALASGTLEARAAWVASRLRRGEISLLSVQIAAMLGNEVAKQIVSVTRVSLETTLTLGFAEPADEFYEAVRKWGVEAVRDASDRLGIKDPTISEALNILEIGWPSRMEDFHDVRNRLQILGEQRYDIFNHIASDPADGDSGLIQQAYYNYHLYYAILDLWSLLHFNPRYLFVSVVRDLSISLGESRDVLLRRLGDHLIYG